MTYIVLLGQAARNSTDGVLTRALAISRRCRWPPPKLLPPFFHQRIIARHAPHDVYVGQGVIGGRDQLVVRDSGIPHGQVFAGRGGE